MENDFQVIEFLLGFLPLQGDLGKCGERGMWRERQLEEGRGTSARYIYNFSFEKIRYFMEVVLMEKSMAGNMMLNHSASG